MICTLYILLILVFIILIFPKNLTIFLQQNTKHSTTILILILKFIVSVYHTFSLHFRVFNKKLIKQFNHINSELLRFLKKMAASNPTSH